MNPISDEHDNNADDGHRRAMFAINHSVITGGAFNLISVHRPKAPVELLKDQVAHSAFHNSAQRIGAPRCHPNTRTALREKAYRWIMHTNAESANSRVLWLNGPAGAGKSAIAQSIAEQCNNEKLLLASFFFCRSDPSRNHATQLVATLVYQIYQIVPSHAQNLILQAVQQDPLIWSRDIFTQFHHLIVSTLRDLIQSGFFNDMSAPRVVIIDGLDECIDQTMQQKVLELVLKTAHEWRLPFLFFIASRPEPDIQVVFERFLMVSVHQNVSLEHDSLADPDIELFIRDKLEECTYTHPCRRYIPPNWPTDDDISILVRRSSGQFIYAAVVIKYVTSIHHLPHQRLRAIMQLRPASHSPYSELDAVYSQILLSAQDLPLVLHILGIHFLFKLNVKTIEAVLRLAEGEVSVALSSMGSLVSLRRLCDDGPEILHFHHASLEDYIFDSTRSRDCYIDRLKCYRVCMKAFMSFVMAPPTASTHEQFCDVFFALRSCFEDIDVDSQICEFTLSHFWPASIYRRLWSPSLSTDDVRFSSYVLISCLWSILGALHPSPSPNAALVIQHLLLGFDDIITDCLNLYAKTIQFDFNCALIALVTEPHAIPWGALRRDLRLDWQTPLLTHPHKIDFDMFQSDDDLLRSSITLLSDYLRTPHRSKMHAVDAQTFANAAVYCLHYLCDHAGAEQTVIPALNFRLRLMRRTRPWRWRWRCAVNKIRGWKETSWMWVVYFWDRKQSLVLRPKRYRALYAHEQYAAWKWPGCNPMAVENMLQSERYWLGLHYLPIFLARAGQSDTLIDMCRSEVFASKSQDFPGMSRRARASMREYLERLEIALY